MCSLGIIIKCTGAPDGIWIAGEVVVMQRVGRYHPRPFSRTGGQHLPP
jgi:hypothetical protein